MPQSASLSDDQDNFKIRHQTIRSFNAYINECQAGGVTALSSYQRASQYDRNNLASGYRRFLEKLERFSEWQDMRATRNGYGMVYQGRQFDWITFKTGDDPSAVDGWQRIDAFYPELGPSPESISVMMDEYVHDSITSRIPAAAPPALDKASLTDAVGLWDAIARSFQVRPNTFKKPASNWSPESTMPEQQHLLAKHKRHPPHRNASA